MLHPKQRRHPRPLYGAGHTQVTAPVELPTLAGHPLVTVTYTLVLLESSCGECPEDDPFPPADATMRITYRHQDTGPLYVTDVCSASCADPVLKDLIQCAEQPPGQYRLRPVGITLCLPSDDAPVGAA